MEQQESDIPRGLVTPISIDEIQQYIGEWQNVNFPDCTEWELALGVCEEAGELAQTILKMHRAMDPGTFNDEKLKDDVADIIIYAMGICSARGWLMSEILESTSKKVLARRWKGDLDAPRPKK